MKQTSQARRLRAHLSEFQTNMLHLRNPWVAVFWSFALPGCGNLMQGRLMKGLIIICWEFVVNTNAKINLAIMYSLLGKADAAKHVVNTRWLLLYVPVYVYAMWDSYRCTVDINQHYVLADIEDAPLNPVVMNSLDVNCVDRRVPWWSAVLSALLPGLGHLYVHKVITGFFFIGWTVSTVYLSHTGQAIYYTFAGNFNSAQAVLDMQWLMYIPSIYGFVIYDACISAVEYNKLFKKLQSQFLRREYQPNQYRMPV